jgi:hypothetical protein
MIPVRWTEIFGTENGCSPGQIQSGEYRLGKQLPWVLRVFYEKFGSHSFNQIHNRLIMPESLEADKNGFVCFYEENQEVVLWAIQIEDFSEEDPSVYESYDDGKTWDLHEDKELLSHFLTDVSLFQGIMGGFPFTAGHLGVDQATEEKIKAEFPPYAADVVKRGMRYYGTPRQLLAIMEGKDSNDLWIAAQKKTPFLKLLQQLKIGWDYHSLED